MKRTPATHVRPALFGLVVTALSSSALAACGASMQAPVDRLASTDAAIRSARELGAPDDPEAALHLKLADDQTAQARQLMHDGENIRADRMLQRAKTDAELAVLLTKERRAKTDADQARQKLERVKSPGGAQ